MEVYLFIAAITAVPLISEVCSNPPDDTSGEYVELFNGSSQAVDVSGFSLTDGDALDPLYPWEGVFPQGDVITGTTIIPAGGYALLFEEDYADDPWLTIEPGTIILTTGDHSICNGLAASSDPLTLFNQDGTTADCVVSTFGTPFDSDIWEDRDDDGLDSIPFDPGEGNSVFRFPSSMPDCESAWFTAAPTPGAPPEAPPDTFVITIDSLLISDTNPPAGSGVFLTAMVSCWGTTSPDTGSVILFLDINGDSTAQQAEQLLSFGAHQLSPGTTDTLQAYFTAPEQGWYPAVCQVLSQEKRVHFSTDDGINPLITEVMANPQIEDQEEYFEVYYPGPGVFPLHGCSFTDGDAIDQIQHFQNSEYLSTNQAGLVIDPEYSGTLDIPQDTPLFVPGNTTIGNGLTTDDPVLLYLPGEPCLNLLLSTAGSPQLHDDPLLCDDDGLDSIPFDPGDGHSIEKLLPEGPDQAFNWRASQPGGSPGLVEENPGWTDLATDAVIYQNCLKGIFQNCGLFQEEGEVTFFSDSNGDLLPDPPEIIHQTSISLQPGETDSLICSWAPPDSGIFTLSATIHHPLDTITCNNTSYTQYLALKTAWPAISEVLCNPSDEDCDEFIEVYFPGPGQVDLTVFTISDGDAVDNITGQTSSFLVSDSYALILDPEYTSGGMPYDIPPGTPVFNPGNTTIGDGLSGTDPVLLLIDSSVVSTYGTPENPSDEIPFDPGCDFSVERILPSLPDAENSWFSSPEGPTPGLPPQVISQGVDYSVTVVEAAPPMGPEGTDVLLSAAVTSAGTDSVSQGQLILCFTIDGQTLESFSPAIPGFQDTIAVHCSWTAPEEPAEITASILCSEDANPANDEMAAVWNAPPTLVINEIFYHEVEWVELCNGTEIPFQLGDVTLSDKSSEVILPDEILAPGEYCILTDDFSDFTASWGTVQCQVYELDGWPTLNNSGDSLELAASDGAIDMVPYTSDWGGGSQASLERRSGLAPGFTGDNWGTCIHLTGGTPGAVNSIGETSRGDFLELNPVIFNPPDTPLQIEINLPVQAGNVVVKLYDVRGMELERLHEGIVPGETLILQWDGEGFPVGRYIIYANAVCSGQMLEDAGVVVLARPFR